MSSTVAATSTEESADCRNRTPAAAMNGASEPPTVKP